jgi:hypothetical protein
MAVASNLVWEQTRNQIIEGALRKCQVLAKGQTPSAEDYTDCALALNNLIQTLSTEGMPLWKRTVVTITPVAGTKDYTVSNVWKITQVLLTDINSSTQYELENQSLYSLNTLPATAGQPVNYCVLPGLQDATLRVWPIPDSSTASNKRLSVVYQKEYGNFDLSTDTPDFPSYWTEALIYGLATRIAPEYGVPLEDRKALEITYEKTKAAAEGYMDEEGSFFISPERRR